MLWRHEGGGGEGHGAGGSDRWQATTMNVVDGGGTTAAAAAADGGGVDVAPFLWRFHGCFGVVLKVKWCRFGDKTGAIFGGKWYCFGYCLAVVLAASCWD